MVICHSFVSYLTRQYSLIYDFYHVIMQYGLPSPLGLLRADNNLPPWRPGLKEVTSCSLQLIFGAYSSHRIAVSVTPPTTYFLVLLKLLLSFENLC